jgi:hypothetical protein
MGQHEQWIILAEEAAQEKDPEKLMKIIKALTEALDTKGRPQMRTVARKSKARHNEN